MATSRVVFRVQRAMRVRALYARGRVGDARGGGFGRRILAGRGQVVRNTADSSGSASSSSLPFCQLNLLFFQCTCTCTTMYPMHYLYYVQAAKRISISSIPCEITRRFYLIDRSRTIFKNKCQFFIYFEIKLRLYATFIRTRRITRAFARLVLKIQKFACRCILT